MASENEYIKQLQEKIEPNIHGILRKFNKLLEEEYGLSGLAVVEFRLDKSEKFEALVSTTQARCWDCGLPIRCCGLQANSRDNVEPSSTTKEYRDTTDELTRLDVISQGTPPEPPPQ